MLIRHEDTQPGATWSDGEGHTYKATAESVFNVPDDVGRKQINFAHWEQYTGVDLDHDPLKDLAEFNISERWNTVGGAELKALIIEVLRHQEARLEAVEGQFVTFERQLSGRPQHPAKRR